MPIAQRAAVLLVLLLGLGLIWSGWQMSLAGLASYQAQAFLHDWAKTSLPPSAQAWKIGNDAAKRSVRWYPVANGEYLDRLGSTYSWQQYQRRYSDPDAEPARRAALAAYSAALLVRPTEPGTWMRLAHSKRNLLEFDEEFEQALDMAFRLGPWRIAVNRELAQIGFGAWAQLSSAQRMATLESAHRGVLHSRHEALRMVDLAQQSGQLLTLCERLDRALKLSRKVCL